MPVGEIFKRLTGGKEVLEDGRRPCPGRGRDAHSQAPGSTDEIDRVMACNECMDVATGLRTDG